MPAELAALGRAQAAHFGRPQDVEWAYADGRVWLVQARPMTALPRHRSGSPGESGQLGLQLMDYMSVRPYPLDASAWVLPGIGRMVQRMLAEIPGLRADVPGMLPEREGVVERFVPCVPQLHTGGAHRADPRRAPRSPVRPGHLDGGPALRTVPGGGAGSPGSTPRHRAGDS